MTSAKQMTETDIRAEIKQLRHQFNSMRDDPEFDGHGGSPGEWMDERIGELEHELKLRGVEI